MKKILLILLVAIFAVAGALSLSACSGKTDTPGSKWVNSEQLKYSIIDNQNDSYVGVLTVKTQTVAENTATLPRSGVSVDLTRTVTSRALVTMLALDTDGNEIMYSESIMEGFSPRASYKSVDYNGKSYAVSASYDGKYYRYSLNGGEENKIKIKAGFCDNELLYTVIRCYSVDANYSGTFTVVDPLEGTKATLNVGTYEDVTFNPTNPCTYTTGNGTSGTLGPVNAVTLSIYGSSTPVGQYAFVTYSKEGDGTVFMKLAGVGSSGKYSTHVPLIIIENNLTYQLMDATAIA